MAPERNLSGLPATPEIRHDLQLVETLLTQLRDLPVEDDSDHEDLCWLQQRRAFLSEVLASRAALGQRPVVSLALWRSGGLSAKKPRADAPAWPHQRCLRSESSQL